MLLGTGAGREPAPPPVLAWKTLTILENTNHVQLWPDAGQSATAEAAPTADFLGLPSG